MCACFLLPLCRPRRHRCCCCWCVCVCEPCAKTHLYNKHTQRKHCTFQTIYVRINVDVACVANVVSCFCAPRATLSHPFLTLAHHPASLSHSLSVAGYVCIRIVVQMCVYIWYTCLFGWVVLLFARAPILSKCHFLAIKIKQIIARKTSTQI